MRKQKDDMQVNVAGLRRNIKNLAHNYSEAQVKVREATSNDPWGPSASLMAEIADLSYNVVAFSEIMQMIWKRLNDHGKNWRHVYKALILLEYLIKTGSEKVAQQCKENVFAIQTLREFVYFEENKDQGIHVREKARQLVNLLKDDERLKNERAKALKAKERFAQHASGFGSDGYIEGPIHRETPVDGNDVDSKPVSEIEFVRPQTAGEEELQLQLAMAMSREEAEQEEAKRRSDDVRLQLALSQSEHDFKLKRDSKLETGKSQQSHLMDLLDISFDEGKLSNEGEKSNNLSQDDCWKSLNKNTKMFQDSWPIPKENKDIWDIDSNMQTNSMRGNNTWSITPSPGFQADIFDPKITSGKFEESNNSLSPTTDFLSEQKTVIRDPWLDNSLTGSELKNDSWSDPNKKDFDNIWGNKTDPWTPAPNEKRPSPVGALNSPIVNLSEFDELINRNINQEKNSNNNFDVNCDNTVNNNASFSRDLNISETKKVFKSPQAFLGENSSLVNLDNLIKPTVPNTNVTAQNPFNDISGTGISQTRTVSPNNLLHHQVPSIYQVKNQPNFQSSIKQDPWAPIQPVNSSQQNNNLSWILSENNSASSSNPFAP